jgi:hypothetical protein
MRVQLMCGATRGHDSAFGGSERRNDWLKCGAFRSGEFVAVTAEFVTLAKPASAASRHHCMGH